MRKKKINKIIYIYIKYLVKSKEEHVDWWEKKTKQKKKKNKIKKKKNTL